MEDLKTMNIKDLFEKAENGVLTLDQFETLAKELGANFKDVKEGNYVSKAKYDSDLKAKDSELESLNGKLTDLNGTITTRDADLEALKKQLAEAGQDATKLAELTTQFGALQTKYDNDIKEAEAKMQRQAYEFAVTEFANTKKFTSPAAKRDFTRAMIEKGLQMEEGKLMGAEDFVAIYSKDNAASFVTETPTPNPTPAPIITAPTPGNGESQPNTGFNFNFRGVH